MPAPKNSPKPKLRPKYLGLDKASINEIENIEAEDKMFVTDEETGVTKRLRGDTQKFSYGGDVRFNANRGKTY
tara:strand:+ start:279 stop:497 length:219 start_codon:yes stop_codon:yes gene_type:complete